MNTLNINDYKNDVTEVNIAEEEAFKSLELAMEKAKQHVPAPQPTLETALKTIAEQFTALSGLLATVIKAIDEQPKPNTTPPEGDPPNLQEAVSLTLEQAEWFKDLVETIIEERIDDHDFDDSVRSAVEANIEDYFQYRFDASDHFDMNDLVDTAVRERIDEAVSECIGDAVDEYLSNTEFKLTKE